MGLCELLLPLHPMEVTLRALVLLMICINFVGVVWKSLPVYSGAACFVLFFHTPSRHKMVCALM